jgi:hypothetical protein
MLVIGALLLANGCLAMLWPGPLTALAALGLFLVMVGQLFRASPPAVVLLLPFVMIDVSSLVSMNAIEAGGYMQEMGRRGAASPASATFALCCILFLLTAAAVHVRRAGRHPILRASADAHAERPLILCWGAVAIVGCIDAYLTLAGLRSGFPLLTGTDRFEFRRLSASVLTLNLLSLKFMLAAFVGTGAAHATGRLQRASHHVAFLAYLGLSFLYGDKFFIVLGAAAFYVMPLLLRDPKDITGLIRRRLPLAGLAIACTVAVTAYIYSGYGQSSPEATARKIGDRVAGQGQLWYVAVEDAPRWVAFDVEAVRLNIENLFANPAADYAFRHRLAAFHFVERYAPTAMYRSYLTNAGTVTPTLVFEAYALVTFGGLGLVAALVAAGLLAGGLVTWLARSFATGNPFNVLFPSFVCVQFISLMSQGTPYSLLGLSAFKAYVALLAFQFVMAELVRPRRATPGLRA